MNERERYIPGVPCWVDTTQPDPDAAAEFYRDLFGWEVEDVMPPDGPGKYFMAQLSGGNVAAISSQPPGSSPEAAWNTYVWVESADETAAGVRDAGGSVLAEPMDVMESGRMAMFADPAGAVFGAWQPAQHRGASVVNEPGAVNFNDLYTNDLDGAKSFYGSVFGWRALPMGGDFSMWALPGYGDHLEQLNPGTRERMGEMGAPEGFEDVVGSLSPLDENQPPARPHWSVTFAVADADEAAVRATELGGQVLVQPVDAPWVRMTVITDPQGATFTASKFVPENRDLGG